MTYPALFDQWLRSHANPTVAGPMEAYMKGLFPFLGIKSPERVELTKQFTAEHGVPNGNDLIQTVRGLWALPEREFHYAALSLLEKQRKNLLPAHIDIMEELIVTKSWWDTVDSLASHLVGGLMLRWPELIPVYAGILENQ